MLDFVRGRFIKFSILPYEFNNLQSQPGLPLLETSDSRSIPANYADTLILAGVTELNPVKCVLPVVEYDAV
jgi:hypothetical protein